MHQLSSIIHIQRVSAHAVTPHTPISANRSRVVLQVIRRTALLSSFLTLLLFPVAAQNVSDALRFSFFEYGGTARFIGTGGAMSAMGADVSNASTNPAGIAWFQRSEYTITPAVLSGRTSSRLLDAADGPLSDALRTSFNMQNLGMVIVSKPQAGKWKSANFAIAFNHLANYNQKFAFDGVSLGSLTQRYREIANSSVGLNDYETGLAADASAIYDLDEDGVYEVDYEIPEKAPLLYKNQNGFTKGSMTEFSFTLGANYDDKILVGFSVGIPFLAFTSDKTYAESDDKAIPNGGAVPYFSSLSLHERVSTIGGGANAKLGIIVRPNQNIRIGASIHTPTVMALTDSYETSLEYNYFEDAKEVGRSIQGSATGPGNFEYGLRTPWRIQGGLGLMLSTYGFISADLEYVDYSKSNFRYTGYVDAQDAVNSDIQGQLSDVMNVRIGGELALDILRLRAGINRLPSPFLNDDSSRFVVSGGLGVRLRTFYLDLSYRQMSQEERYYPYLTDEAPIQEVLQRRKTGTAAATLGFKF